MTELIILTAKYLYIVPIAITIVVWLVWFNKEQKVRYLLILIVSSILAYLVAKIAGHFYFDTRPFVAGHFQPYFGHSTDNGFPSDHTLIATVFAATMWLFNRKLSYLFFVFTLLIGASRVISGVHHTIDIIGAVVIVLAAVAVATLLVDSILKRTAFLKKS